MKKKKMAILSLALLGTTMLGGSTIVSAQTTDIKTDILDSLEKVSIYANQNYDQNNPQSIILNDDYALFYDNENYNFSPRASYLFFGSYSLPNLENSQNTSVNGPNSSQNQNNTRYYAKYNTPNNSNTNNLNSNMSNSQNLTQNLALNQTISKNNYASNQNLNNSINTEMQQNTTATPPQNNIVSKTQTRQSNTKSLATNENNQSITQNQNLINNINTLKNSLNNNQNIDTKSLRAYSYSLRNIANKLEMNERDLYKNVSRMVMLKNNDTAETLTEAGNLEINLSLETKNLLLNYANRVVENLNNLYGNNTNNETNLSENRNTSTQNVNNNQTLNSNSNNNLNSNLTVNNNNNTATNDSIASNSQAMATSAKELNEKKLTPQIIES